MSTALVESKPNGVAAEYAESPASVISAIGRMAADPNLDADKMIRLFELQERLMAKQAEIQFAEAMARLQPKLPVVRKNGMIAFKEQKTPFARYEDIDEAIRPLLNAEGFSISFDSKRVEGGTEYSCEVSHSAGHSKTKSLILPADTSGSKNSIQAIGSTVSYAKRYLVGMHFNIITKGQDDDANTASLIGTTEIHQIEELFAACEMLTPESRRRFWDVAGVSSVKQIRKDQYQGLVSQLETKLKKIREGR
jgi:hypothetical protein